jgi:hypothetical protein
MENMFVDHSENNTIKSNVSDPFPRCGPWNKTLVFMIRKNTTRKSTPKNGVLPALEQKTQTWIW